MENAENQEVKSKKDLLLGRVKERYPDKDFTDEETAFGQIYDDYDDYDGRIKGYQEREKQITEMFDADPRSAAFFTSLKKGEHPWTSFIRKFGKDGLKEMVENEDKLEEFAKAEEEYLADLAENQRLQKEYDDNWEETNKTLDAIQEEEGLSDEEVQSRLVALGDIARDVILGKITREVFDMAGKAMHYDQDVSAASQEGEVRGRNAKIDATLRKQSKNDGTAALDGKAGGAPMQPRPDLGALGRLGDNNKTIWERGGEKRTRYNG